MTWSTWVQCESSSQLSKINFKCSWTNISCVKTDVLMIFYNLWWHRHIQPDKDCYYLCVCVCVQSLIDDSFSCSVCFMSYHILALLLCVCVCKSLQTDKICCCPHFKDFTDNIKTRSETMAAKNDTTFRPLTNTQRDTPTEENMKANDQPFHT